MSGLTAARHAGSGRRDAPGARPAGRPEAAPRRWRRACAACVLVAFVNSLVWGLVTPPFQVPDEYKHVAYALRMEQTGQPPHIVKTERREGELGAALKATRFDRVVFDVGQRPPWTAREDAQLDRALERPQAPMTDASAAGAAPYPPLYYAGAAVFAWAASSGTVLDQVAAMRLFSALLVAAAAGFAFLFVRELLPGTPWAWTVGGLGCAFQPLLGFMGGGVNNDALLIAAATALFWLLARTLRRGLTVRRAVAVGGALAVGVLTKTTMGALVPGSLLGLVLAAHRGGGVRAHARALAAGALTLVLPGLLYLGLNGAVWGRHGALDPGVVADAGPFELNGLVAYLWQFYLPAAPWMTDLTAKLPVQSIWVDGMVVGRFGWTEVVFPPWVYDVGLGVALLLLGLAGVGLVRAREALRRRWPELATYAALMVGLLLVIHVAGYRWRQTYGTGFEQPRYLLVLIALYAGVLALAARAPGRRWGPAVGVAIVVLAMSHSVFSMLVTVARYYG